MDLMSAAVVFPCHVEAMDWMTLDGCDESRAIEKRVLAIEPGPLVVDARGEIGAVDELVLADRLELALERRRGEDAGPLAHKQRLVLAPGFRFADEEDSVSAEGVAAGPEEGGVVDRRGHTAADDDVVSLVRVWPV